jgi:UDP-N-acetylmuramoyl-L-alanyl-D-glutamate--2,6-diaminopimelate ligase
MGFRSIVKHVIPNGVFRSVEPYGHWLEASLANARNGFPARHLNVIGVTGTDGKTSTCTLIAAMLREAGFKVAMMTTISIDYGDGVAKPNPSRLTTLGASKLFAEIAKIRDAGAEWLILETTSHALAQHRVAGIPFKLAVMTNIGHEHLDYHGTFERYRDAKKMLFIQTGKNRAGLRTGIINAEDPSAELFAAALPRPITYGIQSGDIRATDVKSTPTGSTFTATYKERTFPVKVNVPGGFNVYNSLATIGVGLSIGLTDEQIANGIASLTSVEGRMTSVDEGQDFSVIVDYAHTPDSFEKIFTEVRKLGTGRILAVFGSAGRRDEAKRAQQGEVAGRMCDIVIVTEEDDRDIDGTEIMEQIAAGAESAGKIKNKDLYLIHDRHEAIDSAISMAQPGDVVLLLGKGHEKSILRNGPEAAALRDQLQDDSDTRRVIKVDYDEVTAARQALAKRAKQ